MRIIHLSDLHFGTEQNRLTEMLFTEIHLLKPDITVVSGDLTQRAKSQQFLAAKEFLNGLDCNFLCVPGNHDISLYNWLERFAYPFKKYKKYINDTICSNYVNNEVAILGINSVTPYKPMSGYVTNEQLRFVQTFFSAFLHSKINIVVMHHNLIKSERHRIINQAEKIINVFADCNINLVLSGHIHFAHIECMRFNEKRKPMYIITAGTPISSRTLAPNSFNVIDLNKSEFNLTVKSYIKNKFSTTSEEIYPL